MSPLAKIGIAHALLDRRGSFRTPRCPDTCTRACGHEPPAPGRRSLPPCARSSTPLRCSGSQPVRIFNVTGTLTALTTASRICRTSGSSLHQRRARGLVADFLRRTAHVDVDDLRAGIDVALRGLGHHLRIAAGDLHDARLGLAAVIHAPTRFLACATDAHRRSAFRQPQCPRPCAGTTAGTADRSRPPWARARDCWPVRKGRCASAIRLLLGNCLAGARHRSARRAPRRHTSKRKPSASGPGSTMAIRRRWLCCAGASRRSGAVVGIQILGGLELARAHLLAPAILEHQLQQRIGLRESRRRFLMLARTFSVPGAAGSEHAPLLDLVGVQVPVGCKRQAQRAVDARCSGAPIADDAPASCAIVMHDLHSEQQHQRRGQNLPQRATAPAARGCIGRSQVELGIADRRCLRRSRPRQRPVSMTVDSCCGCWAASIGLGSPRRLRISSAASSRSSSVDAIFARRSRCVRPRRHLCRRRRSSSVDLDPFFDRLPRGSAARRCAVSSTACVARR